MGRCLEFNEGLCEGWIPLQYHKKKPFYDTFESVLFSFFLMPNMSLNFTYLSIFMATLWSYCQLFQFHRWRTGIQRFRSLGPGLPRVCWFCSRPCELTSRTPLPFLLHNTAWSPIRGFWEGRKTFSGAAGAQGGRC